MRKILGFGAVVALAVGGLALGACRPQPPGSAPARVAAGDAGAPDATSAVERFLTAGRMGDTRTMGLLFGTASGPIAARDPAVEVEKRMRALACYLQHDRYRLLDSMAGAGTERIQRVELTQRELARITRFTAVSGPRGRWFVQAFDLDPLSDLCRAPT